MTSENEDYDNFMAEIHRTVQEEKWQNEPVICKSCKRHLRFYSSDPWNFCPYCSNKIEKPNN